MDNPGLSVRPATLPAPALRNRRRVICIGIWALRFSFLHMRSQRAQSYASPVWAEFSATLDPPPPKSKPNPSAHEGDFICEDNPVIFAELFSIFRRRGTNGLSGDRRDFRVCSRELLFRGQRVGVV